MGEAYCGFYEQSKQLVDYCFLIAQNTYSRTIVDTIRVIRRTLDTLVDKKLKLMIKLNHRVTVGKVNELRCRVLALQKTSIYCQSITIDNLRGLHQKIMVANTYTGFDVNDFFENARGFMHSVQKKQYSCDCGKTVGTHTKRSPCRFYRTAVKISHCAKSIRKKYCTLNQKNLNFKHNVE